MKKWDERKSNNREFYSCARNTRTQICTWMQDSLPGTRQQCTVKWDVWEPPAAKRQTERRSKPSLMETWHACRGGNSNKRLMGHGAFSTGAKYPPLLSPLPLCAPLLLLCPMLVNGGLAFQNPGLHLEATYFCHPFTPIPLWSLLYLSGSCKITIADAGKDFI